MKNFEDLLNQAENSHENKLILGDIKKPSLIDQIKLTGAKIIAPIALSLITGPFNTVSTLLQITNKPFINPIQSKLKVVDSKDPIHKHIKNGIFGDSKPFKAFQFKSYSEALKQMGKQGFKGIYKGNLTGIIYFGLNSKLRTLLYTTSTDLIPNFKQKTDHNFIKENLITITTCTIADIITLPLMFCQSRLILQNSLSNFRQYKSPIDILRKSSFKNLFTGASILVLKNTLFSLAWLQLIKDSPVYAFALSSVLSHIITYPFITILRQLQTNSLNTPMMYDRQQSVKQVCSRIWKSGKIMGFYRGFIGYSIVHFFMATIMIEQNINSGYFQQMHQ